MSIVMLYEIKKKETKYGKEKWKLKLNEMAQETNFLIIESF